MNLKYTEPSQNKYGKGYVLYLTIYDQDTGEHVLGNQTVSVGSNKLTDKEVESFLNNVYIPRIEAMLADKPEEIEMVEMAEIERKLIEYKYLAEGQSFEDLPMKEVVG